MEFKLRFSDKEITAWGGMGLMKQMLYQTRAIQSKPVTCHNLEVAGVMRRANKFCSSCDPYGVALIGLNMQ